MRQPIHEVLGIEAGDHPPYETIAQVVDGTADDVTLEIVESHAAACARCDAEIRDLRSFAGRPRWREHLRRLSAVAAVLAVFIGGWYFLRRRPVERSAGLKPRPASERSTSSQPPAVASGYGRDGYGRDDWDAAVHAALERGAIDPPAIVGELRAQIDVQRAPGESSPAALMRPAGEVIDATSPLLTWRGARGPYVVSVYDGVERVAHSASLRAAQWRVSPPLARGRTYTWQVEVVRGDSLELLAPPPAPPAFFHVLDAATSASLSEAERRFPNDHLLHGVLYARAGLQKKAMDELRMQAAGKALAESVARW